MALRCRGGEGPVTAEPRTPAGIRAAGIHPVSMARARTSAFQTPMWSASLASCEGGSLDAPSLSLEIRVMPWSDPRQGIAFETRPFSGAPCRQGTMAGRDFAALRRPRWSGCQAQVASVVATGFGSTRARYASRYAGNYLARDHRRSENGAWISPNFSAQFRNLSARQRAAPALGLRTVGQEIRGTVSKLFPRNKAELFRAV